MTFQKQMTETGLGSNIFSTSNVKATDNRDSHDGDMRWWKGPHKKLLILKQNQKTNPKNPKPKKNQTNKTKHLVGCHYCSIQMGIFRGWGLDAQRHASGHSPHLFEYSPITI